MLLVSEYYSAVFFIGLFLIACATIMFVTSYMLYSFSTKAHEAVINKSTNKLNMALVSLKRYFKINGGVLVVSLILSFIGGFVLGASVNL